ncbi:MAG TPA: thiamine phosphate synthase [Thermodesulfovibrionales bacterium]|jgi:thiamine-phosphate pyrophosphorylase|nr:thiamine phosphate synthase [Thermodesulfovibrionales bacterium]
MTPTPRFPSGLYLIADRKVSEKSPEEIVLPALKAGIRWVQYREKEKSRRDIYGEALRLRQMTGDFCAVFIVNDHVDIAVAVEADGVHLGQEDLPLAEARRVAGEKIIGISTHSLTEAEEAARGGADYIGFGPVFLTKTKDAGEPKGIEMLRKVRRSVHIPIVAIGGISRDTLRPVLDSGVNAVAVASAILSGDISGNIEAFMNVIGGGA